MLIYLTMIEGGGGPTPVSVPLPPIQKADAVYRPRHPARPPDAEDAVHEAFCALRK